MLNPEYPAFPILSLIGAVLVIIPLPWHFQAWNSGTCLFMIWTSIACLNLGVNAIIWNNNVLNFAPVWCDICAEKRRAVLVDVAIGVGIPVLQLIAFHIVSGHRFDIFEQIGCYPYIYNTPLAFPFVYVWPVLIGLCSAVYCVLSLRAFAKRRAQFSEFLAASSSLTISRYFRLMALATVELMCTTPIAAYGLSLNASSHIYPWISYADTHFGYSRVDQWPAVLWKAQPNAIVTFALTRWLTVLCAFVFFAFFGFADEARRHYHKVVSLCIPLYRAVFPRQQKEQLPPYVLALYLRNLLEDSLLDYTATAQEKEFQYNLLARYLSSRDGIASRRIANSIRRSILDQTCRICLPLRPLVSNLATPRPRSMVTRYDSFMICMFTPYDVLVSVFCCQLVAII
nr:Ste3-4 [Ganoderma boninense]